MGAKVGTKGAIADINVTPLVDVVLVLLIIFMVVTPMLSAGVDVRLPKAKTGTEEKDMGDHFVVSIKGDGSVYVDRDRVTLETLAAAVKERRANRPIVIKGDSAASWKQVRDAMDAIHKDVDLTDTLLLATEKPKDGEE